MHKYKIEIFWYEPDQEFVAKISDVHEFKHLSGMGETKEEALNILEDSVNDYIHDMRERGYPIPISEYEKKVS